MLSYELAKELRDAGYPIKDRRCEDCFQNNYSYCSVCRDQVESVPTLSELIEACGDDFGTLHHIHKPKIWTAVSRLFSRNGTKLLDGYEGKGDNPESAVANLWLKLNNK